MEPRQLLATAKVPGGGEELRLIKRGRDFMIVLGRNELMNSRMSGSEEALAVMTLERLVGVRDPNLLIGGYGMGFTLRAALAEVPRSGRVTVAELVPEIIDWARGPMRDLGGDCLEDSRVTIATRDVAEMIEEATSRYDAVLLDVDNGPDGLTRIANDRLYSAQGLAAARNALKPKGILAIWSAAPDPSFTRRLKEANLQVDEVVVKARSNGKGPRHVIWFARRRWRSARHDDLDRLFRDTNVRRRFCKHFPVDRDRQWRVGDHAELATAKVHRRVMTLR